MLVLRDVLQIRRQPLGEGPRLFEVGIVAGRERRLDRSCGLLADVGEDIALPQRAGGGLDDRGARGAAGGAWAQAARGVASRDAGGAGGVWACTDDVAAAASRQAHSKRASHVIAETPQTRRLLAAPPGNIAPERWRIDDGGRGR